MFDKQSVDKLLVESEEIFLKEVWNNPTLHRAYAVGQEYGLSVNDMALLAIPGLILENRKLFENAVIKIKNASIDDVLGKAKNDE